LFGGPKAQPFAEGIAKILDHVSSIIAIPPASVTYLDRAEPQNHRRPERAGGGEQRNKFRSTFDAGGGKQRNKS